jgi:hypothetical protein
MPMLDVRTFRGTSLCIRCVTIDNKHFVVDCKTFLNSLEKSEHSVTYLLESSAEGILLSMLRFLDADFLPGQPKNGHLRLQIPAVLWPSSNR